MTLSVFPAQSLPGITFPMKSSRSWRTIRQMSLSGRRTAFGLQASPLYKYELALEFLRSAAAFSELQTLIGFYNSMLGAQGLFAYYDPNDYVASLDGFGQGDGVSTVFPLVHAYAGFAEPIFVPFQASAPTPIPIQNAAAYAPMNMFAQSLALGTGFTVGNSHVTTGQTDPNGGTFAALVAETAVTGHHFVDQTATTSAGSPVTFSAYLNDGTSRYIMLALDDGAYVNYGTAVFDLTAGVLTNSAMGGTASGVVATISPASGGFFRCSVSCIVGSTVTSVRASICETNNNPAASAIPSYLGSTSNNYTAAFPQIEVAYVTGAPGAYNPTLATRYYGSPALFINGVYFDPTNYTIGNTGQITWGAPPVAGHPLTWSGLFARPCRFDEDDLNIEQFMSGLFEVKSLKFSSELL